MQNFDRLRAQWKKEAEAEQAALDARRKAAEEAAREEELKRMGNLQRQIAMEKQRQEEARLALLELERRTRTYPSGARYVGDSREPVERSQNVPEH